MTRREEDEEQEWSESELNKENEPVRGYNSEKK